MESRCPRTGEDWQSLAVEAVRETLVREAMDDLERPHVVLIEDVVLGLRLVLGPFPDALSATLAADAQRQEGERELDPTSVRTYEVALILPPVDAGD